MKSLIKAITVIGSIILSGFIIITEKPKAAVDIWMYDSYRLNADSSYWSGINNKAQITFVKRDSSKHIFKDEHIGISFKQWPVTAGDYRVTMFPQHKDEVMVIAEHMNNSFISKSTNTGFVHVSDKNGKLAFYANNIVMDVVPAGFKKHVGAWDSTYFSFNLAN